MRKFSSKALTVGISTGCKQQQIRSCASAGEEPAAASSSSSSSGGLSHCAGLYRSKLITGEVLPYPCPALGEEQISNVNELLEALQPDELTVEKLTEKSAKRKKDAAESAKDAAAEGDSVATTSDIKGNPAPNLVNKETAESGLAGASIPSDIGGLDFSHRSLALVLENLATAHSASSGSAKFVQQYVQQTGPVSHLLKTTASKEQQGRWFSQMLEGEMVIAWAPEEEPSGSDVAAVTTTAVHDSADSTYVINGVKTPVFGASNATHFIILAKTATQQAAKAGSADSTPIAVQRLSFLLVDKSAAGVEVITNTSTVSDIGTVKLTNVKVPTDNVIGGAGQAYSAYQVSKHHTNFTHASVVLGLLKQALDVGTQCLGVAGVSTPGQHTQAGKAWLELASCSYALESTLYLLTGNLDRNTEDSLIESAVLCAMAGDMALKGAEILENHFAGYLTHHSVPTTAAVNATGDKNAVVTSATVSRLTTSLRLHHLVVNENDSLRQLASCCGVEDFGVWFRGTSSLTMIQIRTLRSMGQTDKFGGFAAQALQKEAHRLEKGVVAFGAAVEYMYVKNGLRVHDEAARMERVAEACSLLYMAAATLSRCETVIKESSKKNGNPSCAETKAREIELASIFVNEALRNAELLSEKIVKSAQSVENSYGRVTADLLDKYL